MDALIEEMVRACQNDPSALEWFEGFAAADKAREPEEAKEQ